MALLGALPVLTRIHRKRRRWLAADRGRKEEKLRSHERHHARRLREPLIPADADTDAGITRVPDPKAAVTRGEVVLLLIAGAVRNVRLAVDAERVTVGIEDGDGIEVRATGALEEADRQHHFELARHTREVLHRGILGELVREREMAHVLL